MHSAPAESTAALHTDTVRAETAHQPALHSTEECSPKVALQEQEHPTVSVGFAPWAQKSPCLASTSIPGDPLSPAAAKKQKKLP